MILEQSPSLGADAHWTAVTNAPGNAGNQVNLPMPAAGFEFFRLRQAW
jgi:hypothetical protein